MGFFSSSKNDKHVKPPRQRHQLKQQSQKQQQQPVQQAQQVEHHQKTGLKHKFSSFLEPPNVYVSSDPAYGYPPPAPPRPTTVAPAEQISRLQRHQPNSSSHQLQLSSSQSHSQLQHHVYGPVIVNQHYYLGGPPPDGHHDPHSHPYLKHGNFSKSMANLAKDVTAVPSCSQGLSAWYGYSTHVLSSTVSACDDVADRLNHLLTMIDGEKISGNEMNLYSYQQTVPPPQPQPLREKPSRSDHKAARKHRKEKDKDPDTCPAVDAAASVVRGDYFSKVNYYANSTLPRDMPPFAVYFATWPLLTLAAQYSLAVYDKPTGSERESHVTADWRTGSKAMCIKSVPMDAMNTIVFAIRGSATFMDWAVNLKHAPTKPSNFLDDTDNLCHSGFLSVARRMLSPVAARLKQLLQEDPSRSRYSLLITGHSAGGAVASLLYSHMLAKSGHARSELNTLTDSFKRVHCVTFGSPPISLRPLTKPDRRELKNSLFLSFVNEGDPVVRADKAYVKSLLELLASPPPDTSSDSKSKDSSKHKRGRSSRTSSKPTWPVPDCTLHNAGRIVVLRSGGRRKSHRTKGRLTISERLDEGVDACTCYDNQLQGVIWGDPAAHMMALYAGRIEMLAVDAVTGRKHK